MEETKPFRPARVSQDEPPKKPKVKFSADIHSEIKEETVGEENDDLDLSPKPILRRFKSDLLIKAKEEESNSHSDREDITIHPSQKKLENIQ